jgi:hypothetical protein
MQIIIINTISFDKSGYDLNVISKYTQTSTPQVNL